MRASQSNSEKNKELTKNDLIKKKIEDKPKNKIKSMKEICLTVKESNFVEFFLRGF